MYVFIIILTDDAGVEKAIDMIKQKLCIVKLCKINKEEIVGLCNTLNYVPDINYKGLANC